MHDARPLVGERARFVVRQLHAVREDRPRPFDAPAPEDGHVVVSERASNRFALAGMLRCMRVHQRSVCRRALDRAAHERLRTREDESRCVRVPDAPTRCSCPSLREGLALLEAPFRRLAKAFRNAVARVHHRLPGDGADAARHARLHHDVVMVHRPHIEDRRRPRAHHLGEPELRARRE